MKINRTFLGQRLKEARKKKGLTQQQLGELTELSDKYISRIETGKADMSLDCFVALINTLEISADYVLQDSLYMDYEIGDDEKKKHISYQRFGVYFVNRSATNFLILRQLFFQVALNRTIIYP